MKRLLFLFMLIGAASQLKAQAPLQIQPFNKVPDNFYKKYQYKLPDSLTRVFPQTPNVVIPGAVNSYKPDVSKQYAYNLMPIVKMEGRSNMPIVKMEGNSKMPVINPDGGNRVLPMQLVPKP